MEITKIVIESESYPPFGFLTYKDKLTITSVSIAYEYTPLQETAIIDAKKWTYRVDSLAFTSCYKNLAEKAYGILNRDIVLTVLDVLPLKLAFTFDDGHSENVECYSVDKLCREWFQLIRNMVPFCENQPEYILDGEESDEDGEE